MPTYDQTAKHGLRILRGSNAIADIDAGFAALAEDVDAIIATDDQGALALRPVSTTVSPGKLGRLYFATDAGDGGILYRDHGTGWTAIGPQRMIAGRVSSVGGLIAGSKFSVSRASVGQYAITFTPAFDATPAITVTAVGGDAIARLETPSAAGTNVITLGLGSGVRGDSDFHFIAIGI